jgi:hypothetical protein
MLRTAVIGVKAAKAQSGRRVRGDRELDGARSGLDALNARSSCARDDGACIDRLSRFRHACGGACLRAGPLGQTNLQAGCKILIVEDGFLAASEMEAALMKRDSRSRASPTAPRRPCGSPKPNRLRSPSWISADRPCRRRRRGARNVGETGIRCIFATAHHDAHVRARAEAASPLGWLPKPFAACSSRWSSAR